MEVMRNTKSVIGVDPGVPLFAALLSPTGKWIAHAGEDTVKDDKGNDPVKIAAIFNKWIRTSGGPDKVVACIESVTIRPGESLVHGSRFVGSMYMAWGILTALGVKCSFAHPRTWKTSMSLTSAKGASCSRAAALFPDRYWRVKTFNDHNYAEAALIAYYWREALLQR